MATTVERRRNQYAGPCRVCGADVKPGEGWLYSDTRSGASRSRRQAGRSWLKFVKCDRCHSLKAVHKNDLPENRPAPAPTLGVNEIRRGTFRLGFYLFGYQKRRETCVDLVLPDGTAEIVAQLQPIQWTPIGVGYDLEVRLCFGGRKLTHAAAVEVERLGEYAAELYGPYLSDPREFE